MDPYLGSWAVDRSEKFDDFLKKKGIPWPMRKIAGVFGVTKTFAKGDDEGTFVCVTTTPKGNVEWRFKVGESFRGTAMGEEQTITFTIDERGILHEKHESDKGDVENNYFELVEDELLFVLDAGGVDCKRYFKKK